MTLDNSRDQNKQKIADNLLPYVSEGKDLATKLGLDPFPVKYWVVDHEEMNQVMAYGGFQERYPHWRWGMSYYQQKMKDLYTGAHAFEIVINDDPSHAYLQESNQEADHKTVIAHVEAHSDFFKNNKAFDDLANDIDATKQLSRHKDRIEEIIQQEDVSRSEVEEFIDNLLCIEDNINQFDTDFQRPEDFGIIEDQDSEESMRNELRETGFSEDMIETIIEESDLDEEDTELPEEEYDDLMRVISRNGMYYDTEREKAVEMEDWKKSIIQMVRTESYYFAPQKMTKLMNEGWASFWQSMMMTNEEFATGEDIIRHSEMFSQVLSSPGFNPYKIGMHLWEYIEKSEARETVISQLLKVDGVNPSNIYSVLEENNILDKLTPPEELSSPENFPLEEIENSLPESYIDSENFAKAKQGEISWKSSTWKLFTYKALAHRNFALIRPENKLYLYDIYQEEVDQLYRYISSEEYDTYTSVSKAIEDISYSVSWNKMREYREIYTDPNFVDRFLTADFVEEYNYFAYETNYKQDEVQVSGTDYESVKNKLLLELANFGKPRIKAVDTNYENEGRLLLEHQYNGINLDLTQARDVVKRLHSMWGRPVHLRTIQREIKRNNVNEQGIELYYDGEGVGQKKLNKESYEHLLDQTNYDTTPDEWT